MTPDFRIRSVFRFPNGMVAVTDTNGQQMPEYQGSASEVWDRVMAATPPDAEILGAPPAPTLAGYVDTDALGVLHPPAR